MTDLATVEVPGAGVIDINFTPASGGTPTPTPTPTGIPDLLIPSGFHAVTQMKTVQKDWKFANGLPPEFEAGVWNYGYAATQYQASQVTHDATDLILTAKAGKASQGLPFESGWVDTNGKYYLPKNFRLGFLAQMPKGQGLWSGLWAVGPSGSNPQGEIDVQEMLLGNTHNIFGSLHGWAPAPTWGETQSTVAVWDASGDYHWYEVQHENGVMSWAADNHVYAQYTQQQAAGKGQQWPFETETNIYVIANLAVAGSGEWGGGPDAATQQLLSGAGAVMKVREIRVTQP